MSAITKDDSKSLLSALTEENEKLRTENKELLQTIQEATDKLKTATGMVERYQNMYEELLHIVKTQYDAEFTVKDRSNPLS